MVTIQYTGGMSPFGNGYEDPATAIGHFADRVRAAKPGITDIGLSIVVKRALTLMKPRSPGRIVPILGRDILSEDVERADFWPLLGERTQRTILSFPIQGGQKITGDMSATQRKALMSTGDPGSVNRSVLVTRYGDRELSRTYVWSHRTQWEQEVDDADWELLLEYPQMRYLLLRTDDGALWRPVRAYSHIPAIERHVARDNKEAAALRQYFRRTHHHQGVDVH